MAEVSSFSGGKSGVPIDSTLLHPGRDALLRALETVENKGYQEEFRQHDLEAQSRQALPVVKDRIALPSTAGVLNPYLHLSKERRAVFKDLDKLVLPPALWPELKKPCHKVARDQEDSIVELMLQKKMGVLLPEESLLKDRNGNLVLGGFFSVPKDSSSDRLIYDKRPGNQIVRRLRWATLPSSSCLTKIHLAPGDVLVGSGDDLKCYYYMLQLPPCAYKLNPVGRRVSPSILNKAGLNPSGKYRLCLTVMGMGDVNSCDLAQGIHEAVLRNNDALQVEETMQHGAPAPKTKCWQGVYLDDYLCVQQIKRGSEHLPATDTLRVNAVRKAYQTVGLTRAEKKSFDRLLEFRAWGGDVHGGKGTINAPLQMRREVWSITLATVRYGMCSKRFLQRLLGFYCFIFQFRKEFLSFFHHVYKYIEGLGSEWVRMPAHIRDELRSAAMHLPFAVHYMRRPLDSQLLATDATPTTGGACVAPLPQKLGRLLSRRAENKGYSSRLDGNEPLDAAERMIPRDAEIDEICASLHWTAISSYRFRQTAHVNLQELRALARELKQRSVGKPVAGTELVCLLDSQVVVGCLGKGRSSSYRLNGILRGMVGYQLFLDTKISPVWVGTKANPADHPSRGKAIPPPSPAPAWLLPLLDQCEDVKKGLEVFSGTGVFSASHKKEGVEMFRPFDILNGPSGDCFNPLIDKFIVDGKVSFCWIAPPCSSFSPLRNLDREGPLRPKDNPLGDPSHPDVREGNRLWARALEIAYLCIKHSVPWTIEHPRRSKAWCLSSTQRLLQHPNVNKWHVDWCMFGSPNQKATSLMTTMPWLQDLMITCDKSHVHAAPLRGARAKKAGSYPLNFVSKLL